MLVTKSRYDEDISLLMDQVKKHTDVLNTLKSCANYAIYSKQGNCTFASSQFLALLERSGNDASSFTHGDIHFTDKNNESSGHLLWDKVVSQPSFSTKVSYKTKFGDIKCLQASFMKVHTGHEDEIHAIYHDVTVQEQDASSTKATSDALNRSMAVIEFELDGTIITANQNFTATIKYSLDEIRGKHHRMFCKEEFYQKNPNFWDLLAQGEFYSGTFERVDANNETLWLEATYNPVRDSTGNVVKIIKFASDITAQMNEKNAVAQAAELAVSTAEETSQIAADGSNSLQQSIDTFEVALEEVEQTNKLMRELSEQSLKIEAIVTTISGIADQTNLLALNAAIEAARAGDQGRGFAVVADEVRQLAQRTSHSTVEIESVVAENRKLANQSTSKMESVNENVERNSQQIKQVQGVMDEILKGATNVSQTVSKIIR
ncbi:MULTISPECIES: methyl-accepting chemotaxis protein [unclassified Alteromonas]|uniref:methyl-accepting chemotaxis protein n=1 Tax=unclassified Alteromonas TaxID=2614992 RepID=UPI0005093B51|nr:MULTISPECIES: PAS domain-containing methyl-accepting chemotaxis protein [unclassified Alteromonas]